MLHASAASATSGRLLRGASGLGLRASKALGCRASGLGLALMKAARSMSGQVERAALARVGAISMLQARRLRVSSLHLESAPPSCAVRAPASCRTACAQARRSTASSGRMRWTRRSISSKRSSRSSAAGARSVSLHAMPAQGRTCLVARALQHGLTPLRRQPAAKSTRSRGGNRAALATADVVLVGTN